jgi:hypothetical protein
MDEIIKMVDGDVCLISLAKGDIPPKNGLLLVE